MTAKSKRSLQDVVGPQTYAVWVNMLRALVPDGRTHRLAPLVAGMLQYALTTVAEENPDEDSDKPSVARSLIGSTETSDPDEVKELLHDVLDRLFKDAGVKYKRTNARGVDYSIADAIYSEYVGWFDMPWE